MTKITYVVIVSLIVTKLSAQDTPNIVLSVPVIDRIYLATVAGLPNYTRWMQYGSGPNGQENGERWDTIYYYHSQDTLKLVRATYYSINPVGYLLWKHAKDQLFDHGRMIYERKLDYNINTSAIRNGDSAITFKEYGPKYYYYNGEQIAKFRERKAIVKYADERGEVPNNVGYQNTLYNGILAIAREPFDEAVWVVSEPRMTFRDSVRISRGMEPVDGPIIPLPPFEYCLIPRDEEDEAKILLNFREYLKGL
jgi:hypothetical protein